MKDRTIYAEKYKKRSMLVRKDRLPKKLPMFNDNVKIEEIEITEFGKLERDGKEFEYAICKILVS